MASSSTQDTINPSDLNIPQWKKELLARRRALGRTLPAGNSTVKLTCPSVVAAVRHPEVAAVENVISKQQRCISSVTVSNKRSLDQIGEDFHPSSSSEVSVRNMRLLDKCVHNDLVTNGSDNQCKQNVIDCGGFLRLGKNMGEEKIVSNKNNSNIYNKSMEKISVKISKSVKPKQEPLPKKNENCDECLSDSSEELQYGPGIVNRLKTRYLSMTLRESQKKGIRPSLSNMRRATSLENMLDEDSCTNRMSKTNKPNEFYNIYQKNMNRPIPNKFTNITQHTSKFASRNHGLDSMKRALSMDTLIKRDQINDSSKTKSLVNDRPVCNGNTNNLVSFINEDLIIVENTSSNDKNNLITNENNYRDKYKHNSEIKDLPPPDLVKQTLKIFETSPKKSRTNNVQQNKTSVRKLSKTNNIKPATHNSEKNTCKPNLSPKPNISLDKLKHNRLTKQPIPKKILQNSNHSVGLNSNRINRIQDREPASLISSDQPSSANEKQSTSLSPKVSPRSVSPIVMVIAHSEHSQILPSSTSCNTLPVLNSKLEPLNTYNKTSDDDSSDGEQYKQPKPISETALENIRKGGTSTQFKFNSENIQSTKIKSYLPRNNVHIQASNSALILSPTHQSPPPMATVAPMKPTDTVALVPKQVGVIRPIVSTKINSSNVSSSSLPGLTEQEIEKNIINRVKSIEQPVSKVLVAIKTFPEDIVVGSSLSLSQVNKNVETKSQGLWEKKPWQNQNTMVFNFSNRKDVPDYIENDGLILKGQRERPRPGEGGIILLDGAGEESSTDFDPEDWISDPPSPCDVTFVGDNVLINGKSNLSKQPKQRKLRIQFNDEATTMFEYPSETSMAEEEDPAATTTCTDSPAPPIASPTIPMTIGGTLGNYTPRQLGHGSGESFQLGVSRSVPAVAPPTPGAVVEDPHIKPAPPECTVAWSEGSAPDLLF